MLYKATGLSLTFHAIEWECAFSSLCSIVVSEKSIVVVCQVLPLYCSMSITPQLHCYYYYSLTQSRKFNGVKLIENISLKCQTRLSSQAILASSYSRKIRTNAFSLKLIFELLNPRLSLSSHTTPTHPPSSQGLKYQSPHPICLHQRHPCPW